MAVIADTTRSGANERNLDIVRNTLRAYEQEHREVSAAQAGSDSLGVDPPSGALRVRGDD